MSMLFDKLNSDLASALKGKEEIKVSTLRFLLAALKNRIIDLRPSGKELDDQEVLSVLSKQVKQRQESISEFTKANRTDLADKEKKELEILMSYMPEQLSEEEIEALVKNAIEEAQAASQSDMGKVMALVTPKTKGRADGALVSSIVKKFLTM